MLKGEETEVMRGAPMQEHVAPEAHSCPHRGINGRADTSLRQASKQKKSNRNEESGVEGDASNLVLPVHTRTAHRNLRISRRHVSSVTLHVNL